MAKVVTTADTIMNNGYPDTNADSVLADLFKQLNPSWMFVTASDGGNDAVKHNFFYLKRESSDTVGFSFTTHGSSTETGITLEINPAIIPLNSSMAPTGSENDWKKVAVKWVFPKVRFWPLSSPTNCRYTICEGKHKKSWMMSIVESTKSFDVYTSLVGIDSIGEAFAMSLSSIDNNLHQECLSGGQWFNGTLSKGRDSIFNNPPASIQQMGFGPNGHNLSLIPFINPKTGAVCEDLYLPLSGPTSTALYDITVNNRHFVTGASNNTDSDISSVSIDEYNCMTKVFMEV